MPSSSSPPPPSPHLPGIRHNHKKKKPRALPLKAFHALPSSRDWAELPVDALLYVFNNIDHVELVLGAAAGVCRSWRRVATQEPVLWRHIDLSGQAKLAFRTDVDLHELARTAVRRSAGLCHAFWSECAGDDDFLLFLAEQ